MVLLLLAIPIHISLEARVARMVLVWYSTTLLQRSCRSGMYVLNLNSLNKQEAAII